MSELKLRANLLYIQLLSIQSGKLFNTSSKKNPITKKYMRNGKSRSRKLIKIKYSLISSGLRKSKILVINSMQTNSINRLLLSTPKLLLMTLITQQFIYSGSCTQKYCGLLSSSQIVLKSIGSLQRSQEKWKEYQNDIQIGSSIQRDGKSN